MAWSRNQFSDLLPNFHNDGCNRFPVKLLRNKHSYKQNQQSINIVTDTVDRGEVLTGTQLDIDNLNVSCGPCELFINPRPISNLQGQNVKTTMEWYCKTVNRLIFNRDIYNPLGHKDRYLWIRDIVQVTLI